MSKGLEAFEKALDIICCQKHNEQLQEYVDLVEKELKAFDIITRHLNIHVEYDETNDKYVIKFGCITFCDISKEEYELLKEVLL